MQCNLGRKSQFLDKTVVTLFQANAQPHNAQVVMSLLADTGGARVKHHPTVQTSTAVIYETFQYLTL